MITSDENTGTYAVLIGMVVVVFAAVGLSLLADKKSLFSGLGNQLETRIDAAEAELATLRTRQRALSSELTLLAPARKSEDKQLRKALRETAGRDREIAGLAAQRDQLEQQLDDLANGFETERRAIRARIWRDAVGEEVGTLRTRDGRVFESVVIARVTAAGLAIRHKHGNARLGPTELGEEYQERFQWSATERTALLDEERRRRDAMFPSQKRPTPKPTRRQVTRRTKEQAPRPDADEIRKLRADVIAWRDKMSRLRLEKNKAAGNRYRDNKSVPGSLETWDARHERLSRQLDKARARWITARSRLAARAPDDPLLRQPSETP